MIFPNIPYLITVCCLLPIIFISVKKYLSSKNARSEDFYLVSAVIFVFLNYAAQYYTYLHGHYILELITFSHLMKLFSFWGFTSFFVFQAYFKHNIVFRIHKIMLLLTFIILSTIISSNNVGNYSLIAIAQATNLYHSISLLSNTVSDIMVEVTCFVFSCALFLPIRKYTLINRKILYTGVLFTSISYGITSFNIIFYQGLQYIMFLVSQSIGSIATIIMLSAVLSYFKKDTRYHKKENKLKDDISLYL